MLKRGRIKYKQEMAAMVHPFFLLSVWVLALSSLSVSLNSDKAIAGVAHIKGVCALPSVPSTSSSSSSSSSRGKYRRHSTMSNKKKISKKKNNMILRDNSTRSTRPGGTTKRIPSSSSTTTSSDNSCDDFVSIDSFLIPRKVPLRLLLRIACFISIVYWFRQCLVTRGVPFVASIWTILNDGSTSATGGSDGVSYVIKPPKDYRPTYADIQLATLLAPFSNGNEMIPPMGLPSAQSLGGLLVSVLLYLLVNVLLPQWSTTFKVWLDYNQYQSLDNILTDTDDDRSNKKTRNTDFPSDHLCTPPHSSIRVLARSSHSTSGRNGGSDRRKTSNGGGSFTSTLTVHQLQQAYSKEVTSEQSTSTFSFKSDDCQDDNSIDEVESSFIHPEQYYFDFDQHRIYCHVTTKQCTDGSPKLHRSKLSSLRTFATVDDTPVWDDEKRRRVADERYCPYNIFHIATPTMREALVVRLSSPLVVVQMIGFVMSSLEAGYQSIVDMVLCVGGHYRNALQAITSGRQMAQEVRSNLQDTSAFQVLRLVNRGLGRWESTTASDLVPGDVFRIGHNQSTTVIPVDALLLQGQCLVNEAILTGESVPQIKHQLNFDEELTSDPNIRLDMEGRHRMSVLFAGTDLIHVPNSLELTTEDHCVTCMALRTGTYSSKGKLLKSLRNNNQMGEISNAQSEMDAMRVVCVMSFVGLSSCLSIFIRGENSKIARVSPFRRVVQCTRILLASIPSGLPYALSAVTRSCSHKLRTDSDVTCSQPGSLLTAAAVDTVLFDKTGTLTADTQSVAKLVPARDLLKDSQAESFMKCFLAGCHSIVHFSEEGKEENVVAMVGDPLDIASLRYSGWLYDDLTKSYVEPTDSNTTNRKRVYIIRDFPFDPNRRMSSSIVLLQLREGNFQLWQYVKGSPETLKNLCINNTVIDQQAKELETQGYRTIALCAKDISSSDMSRNLFPDGLSSESTKISKARLKGAQIHRTNFEQTDVLSHSDTKLDFIGFACFDASVRPSSERVVRELSHGGIDCKMLTGDSLNAALSVARKVHMINGNKIAVLDVDTDTVCDENDPVFVFHLVKSHMEKDGSFLTITDQIQTVRVTKKTMKKVLRLQAEGRCTLVSNGNALQCFLDRIEDFKPFSAKYLSSLAVVARATPDLKRAFVECLQTVSKRTVMMCGDGVNDIAAIQTADVAAALLTGFGHENHLNIDIDDKRRMKALEDKNIGGNRSRNKGTSKVLKKLSQQRIQKRISLAQRRIDDRARERQRKAGEEGVISLTKYYTLDDTKELLSAVMEAHKDENRRRKILLSGASEAARILAEERNSESQDSDTTIDNGSSMADQTSIKPGEVSLVAPFSCLHPSIDGVESILRQGIATAACVIATQQNIILHSLMSCFHLATLYRDGFRYGSFMWPVESTFYSILDMACFRASCSPRPRLPTSVYIRPQKSLLSGSSAFLILSQALMNVMFISLGVNFAKGLEKSLAPHEKSPAMHDPRVSLLTAQRGKLGKVMTAISMSLVLQRAGTNTSGNDADDNAEGSGTVAGRSIISSVLRRPPFIPNFETNVVFLLSILQSAVVSLLNHRGKPFQQSIFENRAVCWNFCAAVLFYFLGVSGIVPLLTTELEIKPFPTRQSKIGMIFIGLLNVLGCLVCRVISDRIYLREIDHHTQSNPMNARPIVPRNWKRSTSSPTLQFAADYEENLLEEESQSNVSGVKLFTVLMLLLMWDLVRN